MDEKLLAEKSFILIDLQTTGTQPNHASVIEVAWAIVCASSDLDAIEWQSHLIALSEGETLPRSIQKLTGISQAAIEKAELTADELAKLWKELFSKRPELPLLVHYTRFKLPFIEQILGPAAADLHLADRTFCTFQMGKRLLPHLKSHSLRALAGQAGYSLAQHKRALDHAQAMAHLWKSWGDSGALHLAYRGPETMLALKPLTLPTQDADALRKKRLALPDEPGVYIFRDQSQRILYVGKALRLKQRVNSYFRGRKTKGSHLNEMLVRVSDLEVRVCLSELDALVFESDTIKTHDPPYNRLLKTSDRQLQWLSSSEGKPSRGPLASQWTWRLAHSLQHLPLEEVVAGLQPFFKEPETAIEMLRSGIELLATRYELPLAADSSGWWPSLLAKIWDLERPKLASRNNEVKAEAEEKLDAESEDADEEIEEEKDYRFATSDEVADFLEENLRHLAAQLYRSRWLERLMDAEILWTSDRAAQAQKIRCEGGRISIQRSERDETLPSPPHYSRSREARRQAFDLGAFDRLGILYREIRRGLRRGDHVLLCLRPGLILDEASLKNLIL